MHLVIINCSPRTKIMSNTEVIIEHFVRGFEEGGNTTEIWRLSDRRQWDKARAAFDSNKDILFAVPLYVENVPGIMLEFLETLSPKAERGTKMSFILQGGFPEASQLRCGEEYVQTLPSLFNCEYRGTLIKGDMFGIKLMPDKMSLQSVQPFEDMGRFFAKSGIFFKDTATAFASPEYLSDVDIKKFNLVGSKLQKFFMEKIAKSKGCKTKLDDKPYFDFVK